MIQGLCIVFWQMVRKFTRKIFWWRSSQPVFEAQHRVELLYIPPSLIRIPVEEAAVMNLSCMGRLQNTQKGIWFDQTSAISITLLHSGRWTLTWLRSVQQHWNRHSEWVPVKDSAANPSTVYISVDKYPSMDLYKKQQWHTVVAGEVNWACSFCG